VRPVGPDVPAWAQALLGDMQDAIRALQKPGFPQRRANVALKTDLPAAGDYPECEVICDEIHSLVVSTLVAGVYTWLRADGGAL
jgi:hypothetical protein